MAAVFADEATVAAEIKQCDRADVAIAALNGPANTVVSGARDAVAALVARFEALGIRCRLLSVSHAFHSPLMRPAADAFVAVAASAQGQPPAIPWISTVSAKPMQGPPDASYWRDHALSVVRFAEGVQVLGQAGVSDSVEIGPGSTLLALARQNGNADAKTWLGSLSRRGEANEILTRAQKVAQETRDADIAATREELERLRVRAAAEIEAEKTRAIADVRAEVADLALLAAGKVVGETMTGDRQRRLVEEFLETAGSGGTNN